jgi:hypothetical protein
MQCSTAGPWLLYNTTHKDEIYKATNTHSDYVTLTSYPRQQWLPESVSMIPVLHSLIPPVPTYPMSIHIQNTHLHTSCPVMYWSHHKAERPVKRALESGKFSTGAPLGNVKVIRLPGTLTDSNICTPFSWTQRILRSSNSGCNLELN